MSETEFDGESDKLIVVSRYLVTGINLLNKTTTTKKFRQGIGAKLAFKCKKSDCSNTNYSFHTTAKSSTQVFEINIATNLLVKVISNGHFIAQKLFSIITLAKSVSVEA